MNLLAILLFIGTMALSLWATIRVRQVCNRFSLLRASSGSTGADAAASILRQEGICDVEIVAHDQMLGDHYDQIHKRVVLSGQNFYGTSWPLWEFRHTSVQKLAHVHNIAKQN